MGPGPSGSTDAVCVVAGGSPEPRSVEPLAAVCLEETSRQRGVLALGLVVGALGKPYASAQTGRVMLKPEFFMFLARARGSLAACFLALEVIRNFAKVFRFAAAGSCRSAAIPRLQL